MNYYCIWELDVTYVKRFSEMVKKRNVNPDTAPLYSLIYWHFDLLIPFYIMKYNIRWMDDWDFSDKRK